MTATYLRSNPYLKNILRTMIVPLAIVSGLAVPSQVAATSTTPQISASGYPVAAHLVALSDASKLQALLNQYQVIRLAQGDYSLKGPASLTISSGYKIYGLPGTAIPPVVVTPGTTGAVLSNLKVNTLTFPPSAVSSHDNLFLSLNVSSGTGLVANNAVVENNVFIGTLGRMTLSDATSGDLRNNRFIRNIFRNGGAAPILTVQGNTKTPSYNNTFLMSNFLTPPGNSTLLQGLSDVAFVGFDAEAWNYSNLGTHGPINVDNTVNFLRLLNVGGGTDGLANSLLTPYAEINAKKFFLINDAATTAHLPKTHLLSSVQSGIVLNGLAPTDPTNTLQQDSGASVVYRGVAPGSTPLVPGSTLSNAVVDALVTSGNGRPGSAWEAPVYDQIPDPAGPNWAKNLASQPDSTAYIQKLITAATPGIAFLPAGIYYISSPLVMNSANQGLIGAGMGQTVIISKNPNMDIIVGGDHVSSCAVFMSMTLSDITLQGGLNGVHHEPNGSGGCSGQYFMFLSHVTFRNMSNAGVFADSIYGIDNNLLDHLNFVNNKYGFLQIPSPTWNGKDPSPGMGYMDKTVFYANQFIGNNVGVSLQANRADNLDMWVNTLFQNNTGGAIQITNNNDPVIANSDFINNGGNAVITVTSSRHVSCVLCRFSAGANGKYMVKGTATLIDSTFSEAGGTASILDGTGTQDDFYNNTSVDMPLGKIQNGYLFNNYMQKDLEVSYQGLFVVGGKQQIFSSIKVAAAPVPQFLWGSPLQFHY